MKTTRVSLLLSVCLFFAGCGSQNDGANFTSGDGSPAKSGLFSLFDPVVGTIPFPFDALFLSSTGTITGTLNIPNPKMAPFVDQANLQDGFSTVASTFTDLLGFADFATANAGGLIVVDGSTGTPLTPGTDYILQTSTAKDDATGIPINATRTRILIEPLKPLKPSTTYIVALTTALKSTDGLAVTPSNAFKVVRSSIDVPTQYGDPTNPNYAYLQTQSPSARATLEALRSKLIRPTVIGLMGATMLPEEAFALAWTFTTQAIKDTLTVVNTGATGKPLVVANSGLTTASLGAPAGADIYIGTLSNLPYYLMNNANRTPTETPLTTYWKNNGAPTGGEFAPTASLHIPCGAFTSAAPTTPGITKGLITSTTACFPTPVKKSDETIPVLATVPNAAGCPSGQPMGGWPVAIFQHGITRNRSDMLGIAPALAKACIVTIAIDLPLHGLPPPVNPMSPTPLEKLYLATGGIERTFNLDSAGRGPSDPAYTSAAPSGTHFINLASLITSRDNLRQAASDLFTLSKSMPGTIFLQSDHMTPAGFSINASKIYFIGHSLGGIVGGTMLGVNTNVTAATLAMPGGGIAKLLDASANVSPAISAGLASNGVNKGTDLFETFMRFAQTLADSGDPINYAVAANANHPLHMIEVVGGGTSTAPMPPTPTVPGDLVVPNNALAGTLVTIPGYLSGTDPLYKIMGLTVATASPLSFDLGPPSSTVVGPDVVVKFAQGNHKSILLPSADSYSTGGTVPGTVNFAVTCEMQRETVSFLAGNGAGIPIGGACP